MIEDLDHESLLAEVILSHDGGGLVVIVEGDLDESYISDVALPEAVVVNGRGKPRIVAELENILAAPVPTIILLDRDFDVELERIYNHPDVVYTKRYNLEAELLLDRDIFESVWHLNLRPEMRSAMSCENAMAACEAIASKIGRIRYVSLTQNLFLLLEDFPVSKVFPGDSSMEIEIEYETIAETVLVRSGASPWLARRRKIKESGHLTRAHLYVCKQVKRACTDGIAYASGHDIAKALNALLARIRKGGVASAKELEWQALHEARRTPMSDLTKRIRDRGFLHGYSISSVYE